MEASSCVNKEINAFNRKSNKIKSYEHTSQLHLNIQREQQAYRAGHWSWSYNGSEHHRAGLRSSFWSGHSWGLSLPSASLWWIMKPY